MGARSSTFAWKRVPISSVYEGLYDGPHATPRPAGSGPVFLGIKNITEDGRLDLSEIRHISEEDFPTWTRRVLPRSGDIVFTYEATLNRYAMIPEGFRGCLGRRLALIRPDRSKVDPKFLFYSFFGEEWRQTIAQHTLSGSTVDRIPLTEFPSFEIRLPPLAVQQRIADILSAYDELIENNTRRIAILEEMARALYREWFVKFRFPGHEGVRLVDSPVGPIPEGWEVVTVEEVADINRLSLRAGNAPEIINYVDISSVSTGHIGKIEPYRFKDAPGRARRIVSHGDIIWSMVRPNRRSYCLILHPIPNLIVSTGFAILTARKVPFTYLYHAVTTDEFVQYLMNRATGAAYPAVAAGDFAEARLVLPPTNLLNSYHCVVVDFLELKCVLEERNRKLQQTRDLLLPKLVSGEILVDAEGKQWRDGEFIR